MALATQNIKTLVFGYYHRLSKTQKAIYRQSDRIEGIGLPKNESLQTATLELALALKQQNLREVERICQRLASRITDALQAPPVKVKVLAARPNDDWGELHGLYEGDDQPAQITLWMRTARRKQVVAFRTFLRTLLHELCHHFDFTLLKLDDSFHTEGFYKRESSLFHQLVTKARHNERSFPQYPLKSTKKST